MTCGLKNSAIVNFIEKCAKGIKISVKDLVKLLKSYFGKFLKKINLGLTSLDEKPEEDAST